MASTPNPNHKTKATPLPLRGAEHVFDFPSLNLDYKPFSKKTVTLVDLDVHVYGLDEIRDSQRPIAVVMLSHGRCNHAMNMEPMASGLLGEFGRLEREDKGRRARTRDVVVVTLDQRNHGKRTRFRNTNLSFDVNENHLIDMMATIYGGVQDQQLVMDFLPAYLFPHNERRIDEFMAAGVSMGGHTVWRLLREDPRITIGVPIISLPSEVLGANFAARATQMGIPDAEVIYPASVRAWCEQPFDPAVYKGKKILSIHGGKDTLLPLQRGLPFLAEMAAQSPPGYVDMYVDPPAGHQSSKPMVVQTAAWLWKWGLSEAAAAKARL